MASRRSHQTEWCRLPYMSDMPIRQQFGPLPMLVAKLNVFSGWPMADGSSLTAHSH